MSLKKQPEIILNNSNSNHTSNLHTQQNKKNASLNMSFLNNFHMKNVTPELSIRNNHILNDSYDKINNISNFSFQVTNTTVKPINNYNAFSLSNKRNNQSNNIPQGRNKNKTLNETKDNTQKKIQNEIN